VQRKSAAASAARISAAPGAEDRRQQAVAESGLLPIETAPRRWASKRVGDRRTNPWQNGRNDGERAAAKAWPRPAFLLGAPPGRGGRDHRGRSGRLRAGARCV